MGYNTSGILTACINTGQVNGNSYTGGIVGVNEAKSSVTACINMGQVNGNSYTGGIVGQNSPDNRNATATACINTGQVLSLIHI